MLQHELGGHRQSLSDRTVLHKMTRDNEIERRKQTDECRNIGHSIGTIRTNLKIGSVCTEQTSPPVTIQ